MADDFLVRIANADLVEVGEVSPTGLIARLRWRETGTWTMDLVATDRMLPALAEPGAGIVVYPPGGGEPLFGGPRTQLRLREAAVLSVEVQGVTDGVWLDDRIASPDPALDPPWTVEERVLSGLADEVMRQVVEENLGPSALPSRQVVTVDPTAVPGLPSVQWTATGQPVSDILEGVGEAAGVGWTVDRTRTGGRVFRVVPVDDVSDTAVFSASLGTVEAVTLDDRRPTVTASVVSGAVGPYDTIRPTVLRQDVTLAGQWGRIERFRDHRQSSDPAELDAVGDAALEDQQPLRGIEIDPVEGAALLRFPSAYRVGSRVTVRVSGETVVDTVREVEVRLTAGEAPRVVPSLQRMRSPQGAALRRAARRLTSIETIARG